MFIHIILLTTELCQNLPVTVWRALGIRRPKIIGTYQSVGRFRVKQVHIVFVKQDLSVSRQVPCKAGTYPSIVQAGGRSYDWSERNAPFPLRGSGLSQIKPVVTATLPISSVMCRSHSVTP